MKAALSDIQFEEIDLIRSVTRDSYFEFLKEFWDVFCAEKFIYNWHIEYLCDLLQEIAKRVYEGKPAEYEYYIINISPGSTKSSILSVTYSPWIWSWFPSASYIGSSYTYSLAVKLSRMSRLIVKSEKYQQCFPEVKITSDQDAKGYFVNEAKGERMSAGVDGDIIGRHGDIIGIDDPLNPKAARSEAELESAQIFITETLSSRKKDKAVVPTILIMQRLSQADPTGMLLEKFGDSCCHICIPAEESKNVKPESLRRYYRDGLMDPIRLSREVLQKEKLRGDYYYSGQYMQNPIPLGGGMFKTERIMIDQAPTAWTMRVRYWDKACLIAGTMITTKRGLIPIEQVMSGDQVLTRNGFCQVKKSWLSKYTNELTTVIFSDGRTITGTPDHFVFSKKRHWINLQNLLSFDECILHNEEKIWQHQENKSLKKNILMAEDTFAIRAKTVGATDISTAMSGTLKRKNTYIEVCTEMCGNFITGAFPMAIISTIKTKIGITMKSKILNVSSLKHIEGFTKTDFLMKLRSQIRNIEKSHLLLFKREYKNLKSIFVLNAANNLQQKVLRQNIVLNVENKETQSVAVYDISVNNSHEFFANGVLVHNSTREKPGTKAAYTVGVLMGKNCDGRYWILDVKRGRWDSSARENVIKQTAENDGRSVIIGVEQEPGSGGKESAEATVRNLAGYRVRVDRPTGDKAVRADPFSAQVNTGNVSMVRAEWNNDYINELSFFPLSTYKDQVDASSGAFNQLSKPQILAGGGWA